MAIRNIVKFGDPILNKKSRPVEKFDDRLFTLLDDMKDTLYKEKGAGLAAVQVGILRRVVVMDCGDGNGVKILMIQAPGKKAMSCADFVRGHKIEVGEKFE